MDCVYDISCVCKSRRPIAALHLCHVHPSFWWRIEHCPTPPKFLVPEKSGTRMHGTRAKLRVPVSGTRNLGRELGSCAMGLTPPIHWHTIVSLHGSNCNSYQKMQQGSKGYILPEPIRSDVQSGRSPCHGTCSCLCPSSAQRLTRYRQRGISPPASRLSRCSQAV